jgi:hypothetical protein
MALVLKDRVKQTAAAPGTGTITLSGSVNGFQSFASVGNGNTTYFAIVDPVSGDWEVNYGTYTSSGTTLSRNSTPLSSSNSGSLVNFTGAVDVFVTYPSEQAVWQDTTGTVVQQSFGAITATSAALTTGTVSTAPASNTDIANKQYVDGLVASGITYHSPVKYEVPNTTGNLNATYNQPGGPGVGVGATLTNAGTLAAFAPDGPTASVSDRILIYNQTNAFENGIYTVTTVGSGSVAWVLTRATDADTYALKSTSSLGNGDAFFITSGNTGAGETYVCNTVGTITFGTTAITFAQISDSTLYTAGTGLTLSGTEFSITPTGTAGTYGSASSVPVLTTNASGQVTSVTNTNIAINGSVVSGNISGSAGSVANALTLGTYLTGTSFNGSAAVTATVDATATNTASKVVARDASGNFAAGTITATLSGSATSATTATNIAGGAANQIPYNTAAGTTSFITAPTTGSTFLSWNGSAFVYSAISTPASVTFNNGGAGDASGTTFNGSTARTISYNTVGASPLAGSTSLTTTGTVTTGTWSGLFGAVSGANLTSLTAANISGQVAVANGGTGSSTAGGARTNLGATTLGGNLFTITNPSAVTFPRFNADNTVSSLDAATFRSAIGAGTSSTTGTVTSIVAGTYLTGGTITTSGTIAVDATSANTASKVVARDASGNFSAGTITATLSGNASTATSATTAGSITSQANSATITATSANTANQIVLRDASGNFSAGTITATAFSGGTVSATTGSFSSNLLVSTGVSLAPSSVSAFGAGQIFDSTSGFSAPGIVIGTGTGSHGALVYGSGTMYFGTENGSASGTMTTRATLTNAGNFNATGTISGTNITTGGNVTGNAATATTLQTARTINGTSFNGSANITITANTTNTLTLGSYLTGTSFNGSAAVTAAVDATTAATASKVVARDASGYVFAVYYNASGTFPVTASANTSGMATFTGTNGSDNYGRGYTAAAAAALLSGQTMNISGTATNITAYTINQSVGTANNVQHNSLGIGTAASGTAGEIRATNAVTAYYSDDRLKTKLGNIEGALAKVKTLNGFYYEANETAQALGYKPKREVGVSAQSVQAVLPEVVVPAPIDEQYLTVHYDKLVPLLIEAIKELEAKVAALEAKG